MALINDMAEKAKHWHPVPPIMAEDHAEKLTCSICGKTYVSRGKWDIGICRECEETVNAYCIGGAHDREKAHDEK